MVSLGVERLLSRPGSVVGGEVSGDWESDRAAFEAVREEYERY